MALNKLVSKLRRKARKDVFLTALCLALFTYTAYLYATSNTDADDVMGAPRQNKFSSDNRKHRPPFERSRVELRAKSLSNKCKVLNLKPVSGQIRFMMQPLISKKHKTFFCPLAKAGSTFLTRLMIAMNAEGKMQSPLDIDITKANRNKVQTLSSMKTWPKQKDFLDRATKAVFGRNPYSRLLSSYVDKLYSPNPVYWKEWGAAGVNLNKLAKADHKCGTGLSFKHFIKLVVKSKWRTDLHFIPMHTMCKLCDVQYDVIGHIEHSTQEIDYFARKVNISSAFLREDGFAMRFTTDAIEDSTRDPFKLWRNDIRKCMSDYDMGRIIWRKLQLRGIIYADIEFPFSEKEMQQVSLNDFVNHCLKAAMKSTNRARLKKQKEEALVEAYKTVDIFDLFRLKEIYNEDFILFGYESQPASLFNSANRSNVKESVFNWKLPWDVDI